MQLWVKRSPEFEDDGESLANASGVKWATVFGAKACDPHSTMAPQGAFYSWAIFAKHAKIFHAKISEKEQLEKIRFLSILLAAFLENDSRKKKKPLVPAEK